MTYPPDDPAPPAGAGIRPFLQAPTPWRYAPQPAAAPEGFPGDETATLRPFVITAGRVSGQDGDIGLETQVTANPGAVTGGLSPEKRAIVALCAEPLSVAEISARLGLHFGVTRILVGDLRADGLLHVHVLDNDFPDPETIMRVIRGLRAIS